MGGQSYLEKLKNARRILPFSVFLFSIFILDSILKWWSFSHQRSSDFIDLFISPFFNQGMPFGLPNLFSPIVLSIIILLGLTFWLYKTEKYSKEFFLILSIIFFGFANLIERIYFGGVHDYIKIFQGYFNLADLVILFSLFALLLNKSPKKV